MPSPFRLILRSGPRAGQVIPLEKVDILIGRDTTNDIVIEDPEVSRTHARIFAQGRAYMIEDRGSTNGTAVNGQRIVAPQLLQHGDLITLGENTNLAFEGITPDQAVTMATPGAGVDPYPAHQQPARQPQQPPPQQVQPRVAPAPPIRQTQPPPPYDYAPPVQQPVYEQPVYEPGVEPPVTSRRKLTPLAIVLIILVGCLLFACVIFAIVDALNLYCTLFPGIVNTFVPGYCP